MKKKKNSLSKEITSLDIYISEITSQTIKARIEHLLDWYVRKATFYRNSFYIMSTTLIVINATIPLVSQTLLSNKDIIIAIMSSAAVIMTSLLTLFTTKETWFRYRNYAELIKQECIKCVSKLGDYSNDDRESILIGNIELIISDERILWGKNKFNKKDDTSN